MPSCCIPLARKGRHLHSRREETRLTVSTFRKYPELVRLEKRPEILSVKEVVATEKIHGSNFRIYFPAEMSTLGDVRFGGRNEELTQDDRTFYGGRPVRWFREKPALLQRMVDVFA